MAGGGVRADVEALAGMVRDSAGPGERASAEWAAGRLREIGAEDVRVEPFRYQSSFALAQGAHLAAAALAARARNRALAAAALASFELDFSGRSQWLRKALPAGEGANAVGRLPARGERTRTVVLVAHHDAAHTGLMWDPRLLAAGDSAAAKNGRRASLALLPELAHGRRRDRRAPHPRGVGRAPGRVAGGARPTRPAAPPSRGRTTTPAAWPVCWTWPGTSPPNAPRASRWWS